MDRKKLGEWAVNVLVALLAATALVWAMNGCASLKRPSIVATATGVGGGLGFLVGNVPGAIIGAAITAAITDIVNETAASKERETDIKDRVFGVANKPRPRGLPPPEPWLVERVPWWGWLAGLWAYLRRAHLASALTGREPRWDAILRALGLRTHTTPIPAKRA